VVRQAAAARATSVSRAGGPADGPSALPVDSFVQLERQHSALLVGLVDASLAALAKMLRGSEAPTPEVQVRIHQSRATASDRLLQL
jgi:hypothetical protein